jgi:hypothetical protein
MKKLLKIGSVMAGILLILYLISWILSGGGSEKQKVLFKQHIRQHQGGIK